MGISPMNAPLTTGTGMQFSSGMQGLNSIDFTYGGIALDMSGFNTFGGDLVLSFLGAFGFGNGFNLTALLGDMFGTADVRNVESLDCFEVAFGGMNSFWIINDGVFETGWNIDSTTGFVSWTGGDGGDNVVPEPATLAIVALGLAGLGYARRRNAKVAGTSPLATLQKV